VKEKTNMPSASKVKSIIEQVVEEGRSSLLENEAEKVAAFYGIPVVKSITASCAEGAVAAAKKIGFPVALKILSPEILHKSDFGGVRLGIKSSSEVRASYTALIKGVRHAKSDARIDGVLIQKMARPGKEFVVGGLRDPQFGPTVMFGLGGIYVELYKDVSFRLAPLSEVEAVEMMNEIKAAPLLDGFRGSTPLDKHAIAEVIIAVGRMMCDLQAAESVDINPLLVYERGVLAVDVRILLSSKRLEGEKKEQN
jgi:acyl-CoA synthetase (NDP forming)